MGKLTRVLGAYIIASGATIPPGLIGGELIRNWLNVPTLEPLQVAAALWFCAVGVPSIQWASSYLSSSLGVRQPIIVQGMSSRDIPVAGAMADAAGFFAGRQPPRRPSIDVAEGLVLRQGWVEVRESEVDRFVTLSYNRQLQGRPPFARTYWVEGRPKRISRRKYDLILGVLGAHGLVTNRVHGATGELICHPRHVLIELRHYYAPSRARR